MSSGIHDPSDRFSNRVADYVRYRPSYPSAFIDMLREELRVGPGTTVADIGSGTGILTEMLLGTGCIVIAVEPNQAMRRAAETNLDSYAGFRSMDGSAEATGLDAESVDIITVAQAFHWFRVDETEREFRRIVRPGGWVVLVWNGRRTEGSQFMQAYETFLEEWGTDYTAVRKTYDMDGSLTRLFGAGGPRRHRFPNVQTLDQDGLVGRLLSSSYSPARDDPSTPAMLTALGRLFARHAEGGVVSMEYDTEVYSGRR